MHNRLSTFSFNQMAHRVFRVSKNTLKECLANAGIISILIIIGIEIFFSSGLGNRYSSHEVDATLRYLEKGGRNQPVVILGDSVGQGIFSGWKLKNGGVAPLACNQATETAGQYFILKRFLSKNFSPGAVISSDRTPLRGNLKQKYTENYVQRCFTKWYEIYDLLLAKKDPVFTTKMIAYKLFSSYKYRLHLQKELVGFTNGEIYTGFTRAKNSEKLNQGVVEILSDFLDRLQQESISQYFFKKMLSDLELQNIPLFYLPPPTQINKKDNYKLVSDSQNDLKQLQSGFSNLIVLSDVNQQLPKKYFSDGVHLNNNGLNLYREKIENVVQDIITDAVDHQKKLIEINFQGGSKIFKSSPDNQFDGIKPFQNVTIKLSQGQLDIKSHGNDPALLVGGKVGRFGKHGQVLVVKVTMESEVKTFAKIYFSQKGQVFSEKNSLKKRLNVGNNTLYFTFPKRFQDGLLRFDPGQKQAEYVLKGMEGRAVELT